ncbi:MAG: glucose-6-phosphate isomerase [Candidatus Azotimanducaceae bacterium]
MNPTETDEWRQLAQIASTLTNTPSSTLIAEPHRHAALQHGFAGCSYDFTKQRFSAAQLPSLFRLATALKVEEKRDQMLAGQIINTSENRAVLHTALRGGANLADQTLLDSIDQQRLHMYELAGSIRDGQWRGHTGKPIADVVHIGIGGSHLGPQLVIEALANASTCQLNIHFVANIDAHDLDAVLPKLNPETALFIIASKSFSTLETQVNASSARSWFLERGGRREDIAKHFVAVTNNVEAAAKFGLPEENLLPMSDWVGGRFSLWSSVGLTIAIKIGSENHQALLDGAKQMDQHFAQAECDTNIPILSALFATWNFNFLGATSHAVLSYDERLRLLPNFLQQLEMESNGKSVDIDGQPVNFHTMAVLWGGTGTNGQHAYHQLLHQGTRAFSADFIVVGKDDYGRREHHDWLMANAFGQSQAMAQGYQTEGEPHRNVAGNHPNTVIVLDELGPQQLGGLLATYEHKVFAQAAIWNINAFDQWGVELGKNLSVPIYSALQGDLVADSLDPSTQGLVNSVKKPQNPT